ncbi:MAG: gliding motility-associated C-terminal domain-containing protein [Flavobacteriia bacterium]|nr:gliding motility-associated C-terminal domain-containing protein [Flavobacteriia bacterium]OJX37270.1 MAG: hypothetical protein BGO87_01105 [Flavobacteriia bacterium 40-80]
MSAYRILLFISFLTLTNVWGQNIKETRTKNNELLKKNIPSEYTRHSDYGKYSLDIPQSNVELIQYRKEDERLFLDAEGNYYLQKTAGKYHYRNNMGELKTIQRIPSKMGKDFGIFETELPLNVNLSDAVTSISINNLRNKVVFGKSTILKEIAANGTIVKQENLKVSNYSTEGQTLTFKNVFTAVDRVQTVEYDRIQTNFVLNSRPLLGANTEFLILEEVYELPSGWSIVTPQNANSSKAYQGELLIMNEVGNQVSSISKALIYDANPVVDNSNTGNAFVADYSFENIGANQYRVSIKIPAKWLLNGQRKFPVTIDPTLSNNYAGNLGIEDRNTQFSAGCQTQLNIVLPGGNSQVVTNTNARYTIIAKGEIAVSGSTTYYAEGPEQRSRIGVGAGPTWHATQTGTGPQQSAPYDVNYNYNSNIANTCYPPGSTLTYTFQGYQTYFPQTATGTTNVAGCVTNYQELKTNTLEITVTFNDFTLNTTSVGFSSITATGPANPTCNDWSATWCAGSGTNTSLYLHEGVNYTVENVGGTACSGSPMPAAYIQAWSPSGSSCNMDPIGAPGTNTYSFNAGPPFGAAGSAVLHYVTVSSGNCNAAANYCGGYTGHDYTGQSAVLRYRQNTGVNNTTSNTGMCINGTRQLTANLTGTHNNPTVRWSVVSGPGTINGTTLTATGAGTIVVRATIGFCNSDVSIVVEPVPTIVVNVTNATCNGYSNGTATANVTPTTGTYTYVWQGNPSTTNTVTNYAAGNYSVTVTSAGGCAASQTFTITEPPGMTLQTSSTQATCGLSNGSASVAVTGGTGTYSYQWTPGGYNTSTITNVAGGLYTVVVTDANGCTATEYAAVNNNMDLTIAFTASNVLCHGESNGSVSATISGGAPPYQTGWVPTMTTGNSLTNIRAGQYVFTVTDNDGCFMSDTIIITEPAPLAAGFQTVNVGCPNNYGQITANVGGGTQPYVYIWNNGQYTGQTVSNLPVGGYEFKVQDANGCILIDSVYLHQTGGLNISVSPASATVDEGNSIVLNATISPYEPGVVYSWSPSQTLSCSDCPNPTASPVEDTDYMVVITTPNGCKDTAIAVIKWNIFCGETFIPNIFSPNGDGENDVFKVYGRCVKNGTLRIFNRWGEVMFMTTDLTQGWDGTHKGKPCNTGVYTFYFDGTNSNGEVKSMSGSVTLVR